MEFINSAESQKLLNYVMKYPFSPKAEKYFFQKAPAGSCHFYLKKYVVRNAALIEVFRANNPLLVATALERAEEDPAVVEEFLNHGEYNAVMKYLKRHDVPQYAERKLVASGSEKAILDYASSRRLSPFAKYDLIMRGNHKAVMLIISKGRLNEREKTAILEHGRKDEVDFLIECEANRKQHKTLKQMRLIRFGSQHEIERFIAGSLFCKEAELFFYKHGAFALLVNYFKHYKPDGGQEILLNRNDRTEILGYLSKHWLCESSEKLLLQRGVHAEIKAYIKKHYFRDEREVHFIKRGKHREIMLYLAAHSLNDEAQLELVYRRNQEEIMYFISRYPLADIAANALMKCGSDEAIDLWLQNATEPPQAKPAAAPRKKAEKTHHQEILQSSAAWRRL